MLLDPLPLRLEFPRSHFSQKTQGKTVIQITDKTRFQSIRSLEHPRPPSRALPPSRLSPGPPPVVGPPSPISPACLPPAGPSAGYGAMRPPRPSTAARSPAPRARDTGPFLWEGQAIAPLPRPVLPGWACTPVLLCSVFTKCPFLSSPTPVDPPITRRPSAVTRDLTRPFFLNDTSGQVRNRPSCVQSARAREPPVDEAGKGRGLPSGSPPGACGCLPPAGTSAA